MLEKTCCICKEPLDDENYSQCNICGGYFHMAWSVTADVPICGRYQLYERSGVLMFLCVDCAERFPSQMS